MWQRRRKRAKASLDATCLLPQAAYGVNPEGELITIEEVSSGKTNLVCPFCDRDLTAKKGKIKQHHFAHTGETCLRVRKGKLPSLQLNTIGFKMSNWC